MSRRFTPLALLEGDQEAASRPTGHAALSASAGTGKTHVLTARVLRLLLANVDAASILCLTFTKAGAAEMAERINARLAHWVRLDDNQLRKELFALGEPTDKVSLDKARTLFAKVLDAPGGLRIQTIHAFAQSLLGSFPAEADLVPGFRSLEGREEQLLARQVLAECLVQAEQNKDIGFIGDLQALSHRLGEGGAESFLMRCARSPEAMAALGLPAGVEAKLRRAFGLPSGSIEEAIIAECADDGFDVEALRQIGLMNQRWASNSGFERADLCARWLASSPAKRAVMIEDLHAVWARKDGGIRSFARGQAPPGEDYVRYATILFEHCAGLLSMRRTAAFVAVTAAGLRAGQVFATAYAAAKRAAGVVDFDDLIRSAERLLLADGMGDWVRFKLDQSIDHILVDEAQDTNERQWNIVRALALEYFAGEGAVQRRRTIFTVGDFKQAIFGFQGTDPASFNTARAWFKREAEAVEQEFLDLAMERSFRSSPPILTLVDAVLDHLGAGALALPQTPGAHVSHHATRGGAVTLWEPVTVESETEASDEGGEEGWISDSVRLHATRLAKQIRQWIDEPFELESRNRMVRPEDILILVRRRSELATLLVARLHAEGVPVAGVDRLLLSAPLAVQDLLAAIRFAVQPLDDLNLASLLVSPLFGWSQEALFAVAHDRTGPLWPRVRDQGDPESRRWLGELLAMADYATPHQFLETLLSGPLDGRRKLLARLGPEARDPVEELLTSALEFESLTVPSLQRFLDWFARGDVEIVRDPSAPLDAVRVITVHGSKGLQAPIVILADACVDPDRSGGGPAGLSASLMIDQFSPPVPVIRPRKGEAVEPLKSQIEAQALKERQEHWRLLYVALTRAEERLYLGGALSGADKNGPPAASWYRAVEQSLEKLGCGWKQDDRWGRALRLGSSGKKRRKEVTEDAPPPAPFPAWLTTRAPLETKPPRPLAPSAPGDDDVADPPPGPAMRAAAERGRLLHQLFERMPLALPTDRSNLADAWLARSAGIDDPGIRKRLVEDASAIITNPAFARIFGPDALAEAPIAAVTSGGTVIAGTVDRLLVEPDRVMVVDFKTGRSVPASIDDIPAAHMRQMAAYAAALQVIFPGREVQAALLYTAGPTLHALSPDRMRAFMPDAGGG